MSDTPQERHLLVIQDDSGSRAIALEAATYSLGRDPSNAIVLHSKTVSRRHAILLRLPNPETKGYRYRLMDGDSKGNRSANGTRVNNKDWSTGGIEKRGCDPLWGCDCPVLDYDYDRGRIQKTYGND